MSTSQFEIEENERRKLERRDAAKLRELSESMRRGKHSGPRRVISPPSEETSVSPAPTPSLEVLERDAAEVFDQSTILQSEFAGCSDPKGAWLAYIRSVYRGAEI